MSARKSKKSHKVHHDANTLQIAMARCRELVESAEYTISFERRLKTGNLPAPLEQMTWYYAYGKPTEKILHGEDADHPFLAERLIKAHAILEARRRGTSDPAAE